jgi:hypothetical protein
MTAITGPSGGELGQVRKWPRDLLGNHPALVRQLFTIGHHPRAGHDRARWEAIDWGGYRAQVGIQQRRGPWSISMAEEKPGEPSQWVAEAEGLPWVPGWYTVLEHDERGLVMSDVPAEVAGCLPFLDRIPDGTPARVLIGGLGFGVVPAWLLANRVIDRIDIIEIDADIIKLVARDPAAAEKWAGSDRLHVHHADALSWQPASLAGCALHSLCSLSPRPRWDAAWWDIWDTVSAGNLPSMKRLHRRYGRWAGWQMSWERPECEAMLARGQTHPWPGLCNVREGGL